MNTPITSIYDSSPTIQPLPSSVVSDSPGQQTAILAVTESSTASDGNKANSNMDTTTFIDDANVVHRDESHMASVEDAIMEIQNTDPDYQSIKSFLNKPIVLASGNFSTTDTYSFFNNYALPWSLFSSSQASVWMDKLSGIYGIRFDMRIRIVFNANRFQQGRYCMGWVPLANPVASTSLLKELTFNNMHMATLVQRTTVPHVQFDLCDDTSAEMVIPYISTNSFFNLNTFFQSVNTQTLGYLNVYPYSPLVSPAGSTIAGYTIYVSLENVKLFGAASPQSGMNTHKKGIADKEVSNSMNGPVSGIAHAISKGFKEFAKVPMLSEFAAPVSWVADRVAGVASIFGFSKPTQGDSLQKVVIYSGSNHNTIDGDSDARPLAYLSKPSVTMMNGISGTDLDEMDFSYIARKPAWFKTNTWTTAQTVGTTVASFNVLSNPFYTAGGAFHYQPITFLTTFFDFWRGSLRYKIKFVRTEFHSGRLQIAFFPGILGAINIGNAAYVHRMIVDIRECSEVEFIVPFISQTPWNRLGSPTGSVVITVVEPLVAPSTVSTTVTMLYEVCGGEDFEVAVPRDFSQTPIVFTPQSGIDTSKLTVENIGCSEITANPVLATALTIGDKVTSFRAYLKRYHPVYTNVRNASQINNAVISIAVDAIPAIGTTPPAAYDVADILAMIGSCYCLWRGGIRYRDVINKNLVASANTNGPSISKVYTREITNSAKTAKAIPIGYNEVDNLETPMNSHLHLQDLRNNGILSIEVPQYTQTYARAVCDCFNYAGASATYFMEDTIYSSTTQVRIFIATPNSISGAAATPGQQVHNLYRALADDGNFMTFISVPPFVNTTSTGAVSAFA